MLIFAHIAYRHIAESVNMRGGEAVHLSKHHLILIYVRHWFPFSENLVLREGVEPPLFQIRSLVPYPFRRPEHLHRAPPSELRHS